MEFFFAKSLPQLAEISSGFLKLKDGALQEFIWIKPYSIYNQHKYQKLPINSANKVNGSS